MLVLGISAYYHNSAAAIVRDGNIIAAVEEERFTREKNDSAFPVNSVMYCLKAANVELTDVDQIVFYDNPNLKLSRLIKTAIRGVPHNYSYYRKVILGWFSEKFYLHKNFLKNLKEIDARQGAVAAEKLRFTDHHISHAASAYYPSGLDEAIILVMDGVGEWQTTTLMTARKGKIEPQKEINFPDSLGLLYSAFTAYLGFKVNSGEYKVMGLAPYGEDKYSGVIKNNLISLNQDGGFHLNQKYFEYTSSTRMFNDDFCQLLGREARKDEEPIEQFHADIAKSLQVVLEEAICNIVKHAYETYGINNLVMAGGVALNCVANEKIKQLGLFENIWIQPAAGDSGGALGAALLAYYSEHEYTGQPKNQDFMQGSLLGPSYSNEEVENVLNAYGAVYHKLDDTDLYKETARLIANENVVGWHQGRAEFGPRALGSRSILGDARSTQMQEKMNLKIKFRESFRPFAPAVLKERALDYFDAEHSPYMLFTAQVKNKLEVAPAQSMMDTLKQVRSDIPAVTHVDHSARLQTVSADTNPAFHALLKEFNAQTGCGVLINTSFNVRGEPIVLTPEDSYKTFMMTNMDVLVIGNYLMHKSEQPGLIDFRDERDSFIARDNKARVREETYNNSLKRNLTLREHVPSTAKFVNIKDIKGLTESYVHKSYRLKTDRDGYIWPSKIHPQADCEVLFLGGSTTECMYVDELYRFPYLAGRMLEQKTGRKINSYNAGVSGNTSMNSIVNLVGKCLEKPLDIVVMMHNQNDLFTLLSLGTYRPTTGTRSVYTNVGRKRKVDTFDEMEEIRGTMLEYDFDEIKKKFASNLKSFIGICRAHNAQPVLMTMAYRNTLNCKDSLGYVKKTYGALQTDYGIELDEYFEMFDEFNQVIRDVAAQESTILVDLATRITPSKEVFYDIIHFNEVGCVNAAKEISSVLKEAVQSV